MKLNVVSQKSKKCQCNLQEEFPCGVHVADEEVVAANGEPRDRVLWILLDKTVRDFK